MALLVALGWDGWGASGKSESFAPLQLAALRGGLLAGRAAVLEARWPSTASISGKRAAILDGSERVCASLRATTDLGRQEDATQLKIALTRIGEATAHGGQLLLTRTLSPPTRARTIKRRLENPGESVTRRQPDTLTSGPKKGNVNDYCDDCWTTLASTALLPLPTIRHSCLTQRCRVFRIMATPDKDS